MNKKRLLVISSFVMALVILATLLGACEFTHVTGQWEHSETEHWKTCKICQQQFDKGEHVESAWKVEQYATTKQTGLKYTVCKVCNYRLREQVIPMRDPTEQATGTVDLYAINDFHGAWEKMSNVAGYLVDKKREGNTMLLNSGDMFQGSIQSNSNYGKLLTECMDLVGFDAFTFGNHEFDWGLDNLIELATGSDVPFLGANIYHWNANTKTWGDFASELAQEYVISDLDNGIRVGVIGVIGQDQITSISSQLVQTIGFKDPLPIIKQLSTKLRNELECDVVVVSAHVGPQGLVGESENNREPLSSAGLSNYVDAVFCAHTHYRQTYEVDGIPFVQGGSSGNYVSHVQLSVDSDGSVNCNDYENIPYRESWAQNDNDIDDLVDDKINNSNQSIKDEADQKLATINGDDLDSYIAVPRLVARAIADYAVSQGHKDIVLAMVNNARAGLYGTFTYSDLYEAIPFDNVVYVAQVSGYDLLNEAGYSSNSIWRVSGIAIENSRYVYYKIAVIDYLLYHQNSSRNYNYFASAFDTSRSNYFAPVALKKKGVDIYNYRLITRDFLLKHPNITASTYRDDNNYTDTSKLRQAVTLSNNYAY